MKKDGGDDDDAREHEATGFGHRVDAEDLIKVADGERAKEGEADAAAPAQEIGAADDDNGDGGEFVADGGFGVTLLLLSRLA